MAPAYWISTFTAIRDDEKVAAYAALAGPAIHAAGGRFLARGNAAHAFGGGTTTRTSLILFDSVEQAAAAYHSAPYQEALAALGDAADREIRIVAGVPD
jgi:uncharacterized protein (DUF1330 family)